MTASGMAMLPWFHRDFLAATQGWTLSECGAYFLLLGAQWEMGPLPDNQAELAAIARTSTRDFKAIWRKVSRKFTATPAGLVNGRLEDHRRKALELRDQHRTGANQTNAKRWGNHTAAVIPIAERLAERSLSDTHSESLCVSPPSPSPSPSLKRLTKGGSESLRSTSVLLTDGAQGKS
jgi:uncharacterized protein YdaU (DUF1376 family)